MRDDVGDRQRQQDDIRDDERRGGDQSTPPVPPPQAVVAASRTPERRGADAQQYEPGDHREQAGVVVAGRPDLCGVVRGLGADEQTEEPREQRCRTAGSRAQVRIDGGAQAEERDEREPTDQMVGGRDPCIRLQEAVVDDVQGDHRQGGAGQPGLGDRRCERAQSRRARRRGVVKDERPHRAFTRPPVGEARR
jgi:hypothetical protein